MRPPGNADRLMIEAAKKIVREKGCSGLRIRDITERAGVNLGMFPYHFRNAKRFKRILLQELYEEFFAKLTFAAEGDGDPLEQLRDALIVIGKFFRDNRGMAAGLLRDVLNGDKEVLKFGAENIPRHGAVVMELLERCQRKGLLPKLPFYRAMSFMMSALQGPLLVAHIVKDVAESDAIPADMLMSDDAIELRVKMIIGGLKAVKP
jgi:AcrR family transcriptional regulator